MLDVDSMRPHLGIIDDDDTDDSVIADCLAAAKAYIAQFIRRDVDTYFGSNWPADILHAQRLLTAHYFINREAVVPGAATITTFGVPELLAPFRDFS